MIDFDTVKRSRGNLYDLVPKENLTLLLDTVESINRAVEYKSILSESMEAIRIVMNTEASSLMIIDKETGDLQVSVPTGAVKDQISGVRIPKHKGIGGWVVKNKSPYIANNATESELFYGDLSENFHTRNLLCVPLFNSSNEIIGVLQAVNRRRNENFTIRDIPVFQALASHIALAVERGMQIVQLTNMAREKDTHLKETHHRIKNNFQVITSLVELILSDIKTDLVRDKLVDLQARIHSMAHVHEMLCRQDGFREVELGVYLDQLTEKVNMMMNDSITKPEVHFTCEEVEVSAERALMVGVILNELLINIYKHAFNGSQDAAVIKIDISRDSETARLTVADNGVGLPENFNSSSRSSIGMWIVENMLKKLDGTMNIREDSGVEFTISFPIK